MSALPDSLPLAFRPAKLQAVPSQPTAADRSMSAQPVPPVRLVPAVVGVKGREQRVYIECADWCVVDHTRGYNLLEDIAHYSDGDLVQVESFAYGDKAHSELSCMISADPSADDSRIREAHLLVDTGSSEDARLTPEMAESLADDLIAFASQLRHKARQVSAFNRKQARR
ncbi:DUF6907 domain-containing protein [Streptomyces cinereoruber]|uniref:DUF6907 domain-containing protein n=1 Tax=Streptomyces cinereoruber TaxID=67260 RepID=UPI003644FF30